MINKKIKYIVLGLISVISLSEIKPDGNTNVYVEKSKNGIDIINISTPSEKGVSDSTFTKFDVDEKGAVLNNATGIGRSHIAGLINSNNNLITPARVALLRVTSTNETEIKGVLEALSKDNLDVILSNKNGITLDGAKFLNIHDMTLTTGEVTLKNGDIENISVGDGLIVSLDELNTSNITNVNILSKVVRLEKDVLANNIDILTGNNVYNINGDNIEIVKTLEGEIGVPISAEILGSVHGNDVRIIATKSGIGAKSIEAKNITLDSKNQAEIKKIKANNIDIKVENDFDNKDKIIANETLSIKANNILNDGNIILSDTINLNAKEKISNLDGGIIHADKKLNIKAKNLDNIGNVLSFGEAKTRYFDKKTGEEILDINNWIGSHTETYNSYNALIGSSTNEAKENALRAFYDEVVHIDHKEFEWRVYKDDYEAGENKAREGKKGKFFEYENNENFSRENIAKIKEANKKAMYSEHSDNYSDEIILEKSIESKIDTSNGKTKFSVLSGNNINIEVENTVNNKDSHIISNKDNNISAKEFNNASSISDKTATLKDGIEKMKFSGTFNCAGLVACDIKHNATYIRELDNEREVSIKGKKSHLIGENISINADTVNFKAFSEDEAKKVLRSEDEIFNNKKEKVIIKNKEIEYDVEENPKYVSIKDLYNSPYFLDNIKYNKNEYIIDEFSIHDEIIKENEKKENKASNIKINAKNLNVKDQELLFNNIKLSSNNILIEGAKLEALNNIDIDKNDNIKIISSDINANENINIKSNNVSIEDSIERNTKRKDIKLISENKVLLDKKEIITIEQSRASNISSKNIKIEAKDINIKGSNLESKENIELNADKVDISNSVSKNTKELDSVSGTTIFKHDRNEKEEYEISNNSNISGKNVIINSKDTKIIDSNISSDNLNVKGNLVVTSDMLEQKYKENNTGIGYSTKKDIVKQTSKGSNIKVKNSLKVDNLKLEFSNVETKNLEANKVEVNSKVLETKIKINDESFKLVEDAKGYVDKENLTVGGKVTLFSHKVNKKDNIYEVNSISTINVTENANIDKLSVLSSDVSLNNANINEINSNTTELNNKIDENSYKGGLGLSGSVGITGVNAGIGLEIENTNTKGKEKIHENSNISLLGKSKINDKANFTSTNLTYDDLEINAKEVEFTANKDIKDTTTNVTGVKLGLNVGVSSPIVNDISKIGKGVKNLTEGKIDSAISNVGNGFTGAVNDLASNIKVKNDDGTYREARKEDLGKKDLEKDISGYVSIGGDLSLNVNNKTILSHREKVKSGTLTGGKLTFNNNQEVKYISTNVKDTNIVYNNVDKVTKDVKVENNKETIIDASVGVGVGAGLDTKTGKLNPGSVTVSAKGSVDVTNEKLNKLNGLENVSETFNNVSDVKLRGVKSTNSTMSGNISNLSIEDVKNQKTRKKVGFGGDISVNFSGIPTGGNVEIESINTREEKVHKNEVDLTNLKVDNLSKKELEENNHDFRIGLRAGTSGVTTKLKVNDVVDLNVDASAHTINTLVKPDEFEHKMNMAKNEIKSTAEGIKIASETSNAKDDKVIDISEKEKTNILVGGEYYLNAKYDVNVKMIKNNSAKTKDERKEMAQKLGFNDYKVINLNELPKEVAERNKELKEKGLGELKTFVGKDKDGKKILYTIKDLSEEEFKQDLAREYGINKYGRIVKDQNGKDKLLGATAGEIFKEEVIGSGDNNAIHLEYDEVEDGEIVEVVSDKPTEGANSWEDIIIIKNPNDGSRNLIEDRIVSENDFNKEFSIYNEKINVKKYNTDKEYREKMNYYYYLEKNSLNDVKYEDIKFINDKSIVIYDKSGKQQKLTLLSPSQSMFHNIEINEKGEMYINNNKYTRNYKYVNEDGYEIVINHYKKRVVTDFINKGTFNQDSGLGIFGLNHLNSDVRLYNKYGSSINDKNKKELRQRIEKCVKKYYRIFGEIQEGELECK